MNSINISVWSYLAMLFAFTSVAISFYRLFKMYEKQSEENEALKDAIFELQKTIDDYEEIIYGEDK